MKLTKTQSRMLLLIKNGATKGYNLNSLEALTRMKIIAIPTNYDKDKGVYTKVLTGGNGFSYDTMELIETIEKSKAELTKEGYATDSVYGMMFKLI